jgi:hypothetical protein
MIKKTIWLGMQPNLIPSRSCLVAWEETHAQAGGKKVYVRRKAGV